jgi:hypothetical protein
MEPAPKTSLPILVTYPHLLPTFSPPVLLPTLPTMLSLMTGLPDLTSCQRHHHNLIYALYYPLLAHSSPTLSFVVACIRYRPCLTSVVLPPRYLTVRERHDRFSLFAFPKPQALNKKHD